jgi:hypothetical protein
MGDVVTQTCLKERYPGHMTAPYAEVLPGSRGVVDSACKRGIGSMANGLFNAHGKSRGVTLHNATSSFRPGLGQLWLNPFLVRHQSRHEGSLLMVLHYLAAR